MFYWLLLCSDFTKTCSWFYFKFVAWLQSSENRKEQINILGIGEPIKTVTFKYCIFRNIMSLEFYFKIFWGVLVLIGMIFHSIHDSERLG